MVSSVLICIWLAERDHTTQKHKMQVIAINVISASSQPTMCLAGEELEQSCRVHCSPRHLRAHTHTQKYKYMQPNRSGKQRAGALHNEEDSELYSKFTSWIRLKSIFDSRKVGGHLPLLKLQLLSRIVLAVISPYGW